MLADVDKPMPTEVVFFMSETLRNHWLILIAGVVGVIAFFGGFRAKPANRRSSVGASRFPWPATH